MQALVVNCFVLATNILKILKKKLLVVMPNQKWFAKKTNPKYLILLLQTFKLFANHLLLGIANEKQPAYNDITGMILD